MVLKQKALKKGFFIEKFPVSDSADAIGICMILAILGGIAKFKRGKSN